MQQSKGLGDDLEGFFIVTGIKSAVKKTMKVVSNVTGIPLDCGCSERKEMLNKIFPHDNK